MKYTTTLGLLVVAAMVLAAFFGAASASAAKFTAGSVGATLTEETKVKHVLTITGATIECTEIGFAGTTEGTDYTSQKVTPSYKGCTAFGFEATVTNSNCQYTLKADGQVDVIGSSCVLTVTVNNFFAKCKATVQPQSIPFAVTYTNSGTGHITVKMNMTGIDTEVCESSGLCPLTVGSHFNSTYTGESTIKATGTTIGWDA